jgi:hypothetical protein
MANHPSRWISTFESGISIKIRIEIQGKHVTLLASLRALNLNPTSKPLFYRQAGVDIDAGNALIEAINPAKRQRPGARRHRQFSCADRVKLREPVLVAGTDGVGKLRLAFGSGTTASASTGGDERGHTGAGPNLFFLDYFACSLDTPRPRSSAALRAAVNWLAVR